MNINFNKKNLSFVGFIICIIGSVSFLFDMILNWKNDFRDVTIPVLWIVITTQYYYNWKTNERQKTT